MITVYSEKLQVPLLRKYPARLSVTTITCFFGLIQFLIIAAFAEKDTERWKIHSGGELFTILYAVIISPHPLIHLNNSCDTATA